MKKISYLILTAAFFAALPAQARQVVVDEPYCREYTETLRIGGQMQQGYGTACLQADGSWEIQPKEEDVETIRYITRERHVYVVPPRPYLNVRIGDRYPHGRDYRWRNSRRHDHRW